MFFLMENSLLAVARMAFKKWFLTLTGKIFFFYFNWQKNGFLIKIAKQVVSHWSGSPDEQTNGLSTTGIFCFGKT